MTDLDMVGECVAVAMKAAKEEGATECAVRVCGRADGVVFHLEVWFEDESLDVSRADDAKITWERCVHTSGTMAPVWAMDWEVRSLCRHVRVAFERECQREREYIAKCDAEDAAEAALEVAS